MRNKIELTDYLIRTCHANRLELPFGDISISLIFLNRVIAPKYFKFEVLKNQFSKECIMIMNRRAFFNFGLFVMLIFVLNLSFVNHSYGKNENSGKPMDGLQDQIDELKAQMTELQVRGGLKVYDDNNQFLGWSTPGGIYIPSLKLFVCIDQSPNSDEEGWLCRGGVIFIEKDTGNILTSIKLQKIDRICNETFIVGDLIYTTACITYGNCTLSDGDTCFEGWFYEVKEFDPNELPFDLPVALPLRFDHE